MGLIEASDEIEKHLENIQVRQVAINTKLNITIRKLRLLHIIVIVLSWYSRIIKRTLNIRGLSHGLIALLQAMPTKLWTPKLFWIGMTVTSMQS